MKRKRPRRSGSKPKPRKPAKVEPGTLAAYVQQFLSWMRVRNYANNSINGHGTNLAAFIEWAAIRNVTMPQEVTRSIIETYQRTLFYNQGRRGKPLGFSSQQGRLVSVRVFFRWLVRQNILMFNPASEIELPKLPKLLPRNILNATEAEKVLAQPDIETPFGLRDRAMLETLYSTGMRRMEAIGLLVQDVDFDRRIIMIRQGKGRKDRVVPVGKRALRWIRRYLDEARPKIVLAPDDGTLFLANHGEAMSLGRLTQMASRYIQAANIGKTGAVHTWRHSCATGLLEAGMDIRLIQDLLGHEQLRSTQVYTRVSVKKLQEMHALLHPAETADSDVE